MKCFKVIEYTLIQLLSYTHIVSGLPAQKVHRCHAINGGIDVREGLQHGALSTLPLSGGRWLLQSVGEVGHPTPKIKLE